MNEMTKILHLTPKQVEIRERYIKAWSEETSNKSPCPCCGRSYDRTEEVEEIVTRNIRTLNALVAALFPD